MSSVPSSSYQRDMEVACREVARNDEESFQRSEPREDNSSSSRNRVGRERKSSSMKRRWLNMLIHSMTQEKSNLIDKQKDDDRLFLLSFLPLVKGMPQQMKLKTRMEFLNVIQRNLSSPHFFNSQQAVQRSPNAPRVMPCHQQGATYYKVHPQECIHSGSQGQYSNYYVTLSHSDASATAAVRPATPHAQHNATSQVATMRSEATDTFDFGEANRVFMD